jgi:hypothetical protein
MTPLDIRFSILIPMPHTNPDRAERARAEGERRRARERKRRGREKAQP